ncbi:type II secretion system protein [Clostridium massiliodielmoense]|uniref:type II secretion system protein n=1 Tax=Clostridium massiliodielmoense TaxID=1776385 RepID=UPI000A2677A6|nr:type II secretion system protein [Clostridium massiliodielmoense]
MENIQTKQKKKKGFTLIELIIVIAILGILALIAIPKFGQVQKDAKINADIATAKTIANVAATEVASGVENKDIKTKVQEKMPDKKMPKSQVTGKEFEVIITSDNDIQVKDGTNIVYPAPSK